tara:strand:+ start:785 stop:1423 length:639 start_codon:yes stop_codon:yes gene_type:complete
MNKCLTSFGYGRQRENFKKSSPLFLEYAQNHGYDYYVPSLGSFSEWRESNTSKGYAWLKIPLLSEVLSRYDVVLWIDADIVIVDGEKDILGDAGDSPMSMVVHRVEKGRHPNTGVWLLRKEAKSIIDSIDIKTSIPCRVKRWYEQAALHRHFGMDLWSPVLDTPRTSDWGELPYKYNAIKRDERAIPNDAAFIHAAGIQDVFDEAYRRVTNG